MIRSVWCQCPIRIRNYHRESRFEESPADYGGIHRVNTLASAPPKKHSPRAAFAASGLVVTSLVAMTATGETVGHVLFSSLPVYTPTGTMTAVALGRAAVLARMSAARHRPYPDQPNGPAGHRSW